MTNRRGQLFFTTSNADHAYYGMAVPPFWNAFFHIIHTMSEVSSAAEGTYPSRANSLRSNVNKIWGPIHSHGNLGRGLPCNGFFDHERRTPEGWSKCNEVQCLR